MTRRLRRNRSKADINVVPYIDVMLVLLVIFMISAPLLNQSVEVDLPASNNANEVTPPTDDAGEFIPPMVVTIDKDGLYYHSYASNDTLPVTAEQLTTLTQTALTEKPSVEVYLRADKAVNYGSVMTVMDVLKNAGAKNVGFMTDEPE